MFKTAKTGQSTEKKQKKTATSRKAARKEAAIRRSVQSTLQYTHMLKSGICCLGQDLYSRSIRFSDVNFSMAPEESKINIFSRYMEILNTHANDRVDLSLTINNRQIQDDIFEKTMLIGLKPDGLDKLRLEMNQHRMEDYEAGHNRILPEKMMTITVREPNIKDAAFVLDKAAADLGRDMQAIGSECEVMDGQARLETLYSVIKPGKKLQFSYDRLGLNETTKDYIAPYCMDFSQDPSFFTMDDRWCRVMYLSSWATELTEEFFESLMGLEHNLMITTHMSVVPRGEDINHIKFQIDAMQLQLQKEMERNARFGRGDLLPVGQTHEYNEAIKLLEDVEQLNQRLFHIQLFVLINAGSRQEMECITKDVCAVAQKRGCEFLPMTYEQEAAFSAALPLGRAKEKLGRTTVSKVCSILMPFTTREIRDSVHPVYYGTNSTSGNMIFANRRLLPNPSGFILGKPGFGKSFSAKQEAIAHMLTCPDADIFFLDPQGEYAAMAAKLNAVSRKNPCTVLKVSNHSNMYFNPFECDPEDPEFIKRKTEYISFIIAEMWGRGHLEPNEFSVVDQICLRLYKDFHQAWLQNRSTPQPTLVDFYSLLRQYAEQFQDLDARNMYHGLWTYVNGSHNIFSRQSNVNMTSNCIVYDISELGESMRTLGMKVILESLEQRVRANALKGRTTFVYIDEIYLLLKDAYSEKFLQEFWKWCRKFGAVVTGITQNVSELLSSPEAASMLSNSEFCIMLAQAAEDLARLKALFSLSDEQANALATAGKGSGLIRCGNTIIPFQNVFPKDTCLYEIFNTDPGSRRPAFEEDREAGKQEEADETPALAREAFAARPYYMSQDPEILAPSELDWAAA